jgi:hypothetical protein
MFGRLATDFFVEVLTPRLAKMATRIAAIAEVVFATVFSKMVLFFEFLVRDLPNHFANFISWIATQLFLHNPQQIAATEKLTGQIGKEVLSSRYIILIALGSCLVLTAVCLVLPLLYKAIFRRNLTVFVSFNHLRNDVAEKVHAFLKSCQFRVARVPYDESAEHQRTLQRIFELLKQSGLVLCIPGPDFSFVEHEVAAATAYGRPVILLISGKDGTIPNTADKRYPAFQMESLIDQGFRPIEAFLRFIGGDLKSMRDICAQALRHGLLTKLSAAIAVTIVIAMIALWILCLLAVLHTPSARQAIEANPLEVYIATTGHFLVLALLASVTALCAMYCARVLFSQFKQLLAQRRAQLKVRTAEFRRDDWLGLMDEVPSGNLIYQAMFETAPLAHHERLLAAKLA